MLFIEAATFVNQGLCSYCSRSVSCDILITSTARVVSSSRSAHYIMGGLRMLHQ